MLHPPRGGAGLHVRLSAPGASSVHRMGLPLTRRPDCRDEMLIGVVPARAGASIALPPTRRSLLLVAILALAVIITPPLQAEFVVAAPAGRPKFFDHRGLHLPTRGRVVLRRGGGIGHLSGSSPVRGELGARHSAISKDHFRRVVSTLLHLGAYTAVRLQLRNYPGIGRPDRELTISYEKSRLVLGENRIFCLAVGRLAPFLLRLSRQNSKSIPRDAKVNAQVPCQGAVLYLSCPINPISKAEAAL